jgi:hypothetical protein
MIFSYRSIKRIEIMNIQTFATLLLSATLVACGGGSDGVSTPELNDTRETFLANDDANSAQLVAINSRITGSLDNNPDVKDGYRIDVTSAGTITITLTGDADTDFDIGLFTSAADADSAIAGSPEFFAAYSASETSTESLTYNVAAGTYYFAVSNEDGYGAGNYTLSIYGNITSDDAPALSTYSVLIDNASNLVIFSNGFNPLSIVACGEIDFYDAEAAVRSAIYNSGTCAAQTSTFTSIPSLDTQCATGTAPYDLDDLYYTSSIPSPCVQ